MAGSVSWYEWYGAGAHSWSFFDNRVLHNQAANYWHATSDGTEAARIGGTAAFPLDSGVGDCKSTKAKAKVQKSVQLDDSLVFVLGPEDFVQKTQPVRCKSAKERSRRSRCFVIG